MFTLTALLIQFPALLINTVAIATPQNFQGFGVQILLESELLNTASEDDVVPPRIMIQPHGNSEDDVVPPRSV